MNMDMKEEEEGLCEEDNAEREAEERRGLEE